jgi:UPF0716 protein FxsA
MRLLIIFCLLIFPISEIWLLITLFQHYGVVVLLYLVVIAYLGLRLIREEKGLFSSRMMQGLLQGAHPIKSLFGSARNMIAGILLMIPGVITDIIAVILLLMPVNQNFKQGQYHQDKNHQHTAANDDVIEGEFRRED